MLRIGKEKLEDGISYPDLVQELKQCGFKDITENSTFLSHYFFRVFFQKYVAEMFPPHHSSKFYLRPECYIQLLEYDNAKRAGKEAKMARNLSIASVLLALASIVVSIILR